MTTDYDNEIADHIPQEPKKNSGPDWNAIYKKLSGIENDLEQIVDEWVKKNPKWRIEVTFLNYPPRLFLDCYLVKTHPLRREQHTDLYKDIISAAAEITDEELDELTTLITPVVEKHNLRCKKSFRAGFVQYKLQVQFKET